jgi:Transcription factor zinc-finger
MSDTIYHCIRCGQGDKWEAMTSTPEGNLFCAPCWKQLHNEAKRKCPVDGVEMNKRLVADVVMLDSCAVCKGTWFDKSELEILLKKANHESWEMGFLIGSLLF